MRFVWTISGFDFETIADEAVVADLKQSSDRTKRTSFVVANY
jgi:hypothetical protein